MAIFNSSDDTTRSKNHSNTSIITAGARFSGELKLECALFIDGEIEGSIVSSGEITIGKSGKITGDVVAKSVIVSGHVEGTVDAQRIEIHAEGSVKGTLISNELIIEAKGIFIGESRIKDKPVKETKSA